MLEVYLAFGTVPEVDGLGDEGVVLGLEELLEEVVEDGSLALADVLVICAFAPRDSSPLI